MIEGEIDDLLVVLRDRYDLELVVANLPVVVVDDEDYEVWIWQLQQQKMQYRSFGRKTM